MYKIFITKLVSEVNRDMDTITMIKLGVMVYQLIFPFRWVAMIVIVGLFAVNIH